MGILTLYGLSIFYQLPPLLCLHGSALLPCQPSMPFELQSWPSVKVIKVVRPGARSWMWVSPGTHLRCHVPPLCPSFLICTMNWRFDIPFLNKQCWYYITRPRGSPWFKESVQIESRENLRGHSLLLSHLQCLGEYLLNLDSFLWRRWGVHWSSKSNSKLSSIHVQRDGFKQKSDMIWFMLSTNCSVC